MSFVLTDISYLLGSRSFSWLVASAILNMATKTWIVVLAAIIAVQGTKYTDNEKVTGHNCFSCIQCIICCVFTCRIIELT